MKVAAGPLKLLCPYCDQRWTISDDLLRASAPGGMAEAGAVEITTAPYTRGLGKWDAEAEDASPTWSKIGKDYFGWLNWEHIGILNMGPGYGRKQPAYYHLARCPQCGHLCDVYAVPKSTGGIGTMWPHLFPTTVGGDVPKTTGTSILLLLSGRATRKERPGRLILFGITLWVISDWAVLPALPDLGAALIVLIHTAAIVGTCAVLALYGGMVRAQTDSDDYSATFDVTRTAWATHWRNFTLARFVGVPPRSAVGQPDRGRGAPLRLSQVDVLMGVLALLMLVAAVAIGPSQSFAEAVQWSSLSKGLLHLLGLWPVLLAAVASLMAFARTRGPHKRGRSIIVVAPAVVVIAAEVVVARACGVTPPDLLRIAYLDADFVFWATVTYVVACGFYFAIGSALYALRQGARLPLRIHALAEMDDLGVFARYRDFSMQMMLLVFSLTMVLVALFEVARVTPGPIGAWISWSVDDSVWPEWWFVVGVGVLFLVLALTSKAEHLAIVLLLILGELLFFAFNHPIHITGRNLVFNASSLVVAVLLLLLLVLHWRYVGRAIGDILATPRNEALASIDRQLTAALDRLTNAPKGRRGNRVDRDDDDRVSELITIRAAIKTRPRVFPRTAGLLAVLSIFLAPAVDVTLQLLNQPGR